MSRKLAAELAAQRAINLERTQRVLLRGGHKQRAAPEPALQSFGISPKDTADVIRKCEAVRKKLEYV